MAFDNKYLQGENFQPGSGWITVGAYIRFNRVDPGSSFDFLRISQEAAGQYHLALRLAGSASEPGRIQVRDSNKLGLIITNANTVYGDTWHLIELKFRKTNSSDVCIWIDGEQIYCGVNRDLDYGGPSARVEIRTQNNVSGPAAPLVTVYCNSWYVRTDDGATLGENDTRVGPYTVLGPFNWSQPTDVADFGDDSDLGDWDNVKETPINDSNIAGYNDLRDGGVTTHDGAFSGPKDNAYIDGTIIAAKWFWRFKRTFGFGTQEMKGKYGRSVGADTSTDNTTDTTAQTLTTSWQDLWVLKDATSPNVPSKADYFQVGFEKSAGAAGSLDISEMWPFILHKEPISVSGNCTLFVQNGLINNNCDLFTSGRDVISTSGDLFIHGYTDYAASGDLFVEGLGISAIDASGDLFVHGYIQLSGVSAPTLFIHGHEEITSLDIPTTPILFGTESEFLSSGTASYISISNVDTDKFVVAYQDGADSNHGTARIGILVDDNIIFGEESEFLSVDGALHISVAVLSPNSFVVAYQDFSDSRHGTAKIGNISGTDITFGDETEFLSVDGAEYISVSTLSSSGFVVSYMNTADSLHGISRVGIVSGTTITFGSEQKFNNNGSTTNISTAAMDDSNFVVAYKDGGDNNHGTTKIGSISGTDITFGTESEFLSEDGVAELSVGSLSATKFIICYKDVSDSDYGKSIIGTINDTDILFGTEYIFNANAINFVSTLSLSSSGFVVSYRDGVEGKSRIGAVNDTDITFGEESLFSDSIPTNTITSTLLSNTDFVVAHQDLLDSGHGTIRLGTVPVAPSPLLFTKGHELTSGTCDLFIRAVDNINTSGDLLIEGYEFLSTSGDLVVTGHFPVSNSGDLFVSAYEQTTASGMLFIGGQNQTYTSGNLYIYGQSDINASGDLFVGGLISISGEYQPPLFVYGYDISNISGDLYIYGHNITSVSGDLFVHGFGTLESSGTLFIGGHIKISGAYTPSLFVHGHDTLETSGSLFVNGYELASGSCDLFIEGHLDLSTSGDLYTQGYDIFQTSGDLFIQGGIGATSLNDSIDLFIQGYDTVQVSGDLFIEGCESHAVSSDLFINGYEVAQTSGDLFIQGRDIFQTSGDLYVYGLETLFASGNLFVGGQNTINTSGDLYTQGVDTLTTSGQHPLFIYGSGISAINSSTILFINGYEPKVALSCPALDPTASIQIKDSLITIYQELIDGVIDQLGKNVLLEFDPIRQPCPNCEFDIIRKRSTGVYKIGGPRPFSRERQCPYCKGKGLLETAVTKIIKCLIQWGFGDDDDDGDDIAINQHKGVISLKTLISEADDLVRAKTIIVNYDIVGQTKFRARLINGPSPVGLREDRYCISFWELI